MKEDRLDPAIAALFESAAKLVAQKERWRYVPKIKG